MKPLVYLAAPFSSAPASNTNWAIRSGLELWRTGKVAVIIPHLTLLADLVVPMSAHEWYAFGTDQVAHCDAVLRLPGASVGADVEVVAARDLDIPVFESGTDLLAWVDDWTGR